MLLDITSKEVQELSVLLNRTNDGERMAAYAGIGMAYSNTVIKDIVARGDFKITSDDRFGMAEMYYTLNEVAVLNKEDFINVVIKFIKFKLNLLYGNEIILTANDVSGVSYVFGDKMMADIQENINILKSVFKLSSSLLSKKTKM